MNTDCFPNWLRRRSQQQLGPPIQDAIPYPVYQYQQTIDSQDNPNVPSINIDDAFFASVSGQLVGGTVAQGGTTKTRVLGIFPRDGYDTINIAAWDSNATIANNVPVPIFLSFDKPGRVINAPYVELQNNPEAFLYTTATLGTTAPDGPGPVNQVSSTSDFPTFIGQQNLTVAPFYTCLYFSSVKTNRPFYVWFGDNITPPPTNLSFANFKVTWFVRGR